MSEQTCRTRTPQVTITESAALARVEVARLSDYLQQHGWRRRGPHGPYASAYSHEPSTRALLVPDTEDIADYVNRISDVVQELQTFEGRSALDIWRDLVGEQA